MKTLVVLSALASVAIAAPALLGEEFEGLDSSTENSKETLKREKKSPALGFFNGHNAPFSGLVNVLPPVQSEVDNGFSASSAIGRTHMGFKKPIIVKKKHGYHLYRNSEEEQAQSDPRENCLNQVKVKLCEESNGLNNNENLVTRNSAMKNSDVQMSNEKMGESIKLAKEAVENLQRAKMTQWKNINTESDTELHENIEMARQALDHIQRNFGNLETMNLRAATLRDADEAQNTNLNNPNTEEERLAQWKETIENIQRNGKFMDSETHLLPTTTPLSNETPKREDTSSNKTPKEEACLKSEEDTQSNVGNARNVEDTLETESSLLPTTTESSKELPQDKDTSTKPGPVDPDSLNKKEESSKMHASNQDTELKNMSENKEEQKSENDIEASAKEQMNSKVKVDEDKSNHKTTSRSDNRQFEENTTKPHELSTNVQRNITGKRINTPIKNPPEPQHRNSVFMADSIAQGNSGNEMFISMKTAENSENKNNLNTDGEKRNHKQNERANTESNVEHDKSMHALSSGTTSMVTKSAMKDGNENHLNNVDNKILESKEDHSPKSHFNVDMNMREVDTNMDFMKHTHESSNMHRVSEPNIEAVENHARSDHSSAELQVKRSKIVNSDAEPLTNQNKHLETSSRVSKLNPNEMMGRKSADFDLKLGDDFDSIPTFSFQGPRFSENNELSRKFIMDFRNGAVKSASDHKNMNWKHMHGSSRGVYGTGPAIGQSGSSSGSISLSGGVAGHSDGAMGVFPNANVGGCAIPLLVSCSPSVVSGSLAKSHTSSYSAPAYKASDNFTFHNKRDVKKTNDVRIPKVKRTSKKNMKQNITKTAEKKQ